MSKSKNALANVTVNQLEHRVYLFILWLSWLTTVLVLGLNSFSWLIPKIWLIGSGMIYVGSMFFYLTNPQVRDADRIKNRVLVMRRTSALMTYAFNYVPFCLLLILYTQFWDLPQHALAVVFVITTTMITTTRRKLAEKHFSIKAKPVTLQESNRFEFLILTKSLKEVLLFVLAFLVFCHWFY